jgi:hypothetical protein
MLDDLGSAPAQQAPAPNPTATGGASDTAPAYVAVIAGGDASSATSGEAKSDT